MSIVKSVAESVIGMVSSLVKGNASDHCDLEVVDDSKTFITKAGAMVSLIYAPGIHAIPGQEEYDLIHSAVTQAIDAPLSAGCHSVQVVYERNPESTERVLNEMLQPSRDTAERLKVDLGCVVDATVEELLKWTSTEGSLIALWTHPNALGPDVLRREIGKLKEQRKATPIETLDTQDPFVLIPLLRSQHRGFVENFMKLTKKAKLHSKLLTTHEGAKRIRMQMDPDLTAASWEPTLPGDRVIPRARAEKLMRVGNEINDGDLLWPTIADQIIPRSVEPVENGIVRVGRYYYAPVTIERYMRDPVDFNDLYAMIPSDLPWRMSVTLNTVKGTGTLALKRQLAILGALTSAENKAIRDAIGSMTESMQLGNSYAEIQTILMTWAPSLDEARARQGMLVQSIQGWGQCDPSPERADPGEIMLKSATAMTHAPPVTRGYPPLAEAVSLLPLSRPTSDWESGNVIWRTPDGVVWPYQMGSSLQSRWNDLMFAPPGQGKTVTSCRLNTALVLQPGLERLPRLGVVDIGFGGAGTTRLIKNALPEHQKHLVTHHRMKNDKSDAINPFDLQLGARRPIAIESSFLVNLLSLLGTPAGRTKPYDSMAELCSLVIDELYREANGKTTAKTYESGINRDVDKALLNHNIHMEENASWWDTTDALFKKGDEVNAIRAQRYAVPTMQDAASIVKRSSTIEQTYGGENGVKTESGELLTNAFARMISSSIRDYPALSRPTVLDFSNSRMTVIDLQDVAPPGSDAATKKTAVMYMLARYVIAKDFYLHEDYAKNFEPIYYDYQLRRIKSIRRDVKRLVWDEFHRTEGVDLVRNQAVIDMREGRKHNVQVGLISQDLQDFSNVMIKLAGSIYIIGVGGVENKALGEKFQLSPSEKRSLEDGSVHGPEKGGNSFLFKYETKAGWRSQVLNNTVSAHELWAYSSTVEDNELFEALNATYSYEECLNMLTIAFPSGSAKSESERIARQPKLATLSETEVTSRVTQILVKKVEDVWARHQAQIKRLA